MKKYKSRLLTLLLATAMGATAYGCITLGVGVRSVAEEGVLPTRVFTYESGANVTASEANETLFTLYESGSVSFKRDLALKWHEAAGNAGVRYLTMSFKLLDTDFETLTITFETAPARAVKANKSSNAVIFTKTEEGVYAAVKSDGETEAGPSTEINPSEVLTLTLSEIKGETQAKEGEFFVTLREGADVIGAEYDIGSFTNVGANFAEYFSTSSTTPITPFVFEADFPENAGTDAKTQISFLSLNGQSFALNEDGKVVDNAKPVLVVNDEINSFQLGMPFSLDYEVIDVIDTSLQTTREYYQYNPKDEKKDEPEYSSLTTSTYFFDTVYEIGEGETARTTSVYKENGCEYLSIRFKIEDDSNTGDDASVIYLSWYSSEPVTPTLPDGADADDVRYTTQYIRADRNDEGPSYTGIENIYDDATGKYTVVVSEEAKDLAEEYQTLVTEAAKDVGAGSNSYVYLPSLKALITDNDTGYTNLKFTISYRTQTSDSSSSSSLTYDGLKLAVASAGMYEFKVFATDKAGNFPYGVVDGELVKISSDTIWDMEEIPSFTFTVQNRGLSVEEPSSAETDINGFIDVTYNLDDFTVTGISGYSEEYSLYYFDVAGFQSQYPSAGFSINTLSSVKYSDLKDVADFDEAGDEYMEYYAGLYVKLLGEVLGLQLTVDDLLTPKDENTPAIFRKIEAFDDTIDEEDNPDEWEASDNKYYWYPSSQSFIPCEAGAYIIFGVFTDSELVGERAAAYKAVSVAAKKDVIKGDTEWLKNNVASVVLFSIAGVMLILIIILLVVKPSDETLEDVDAEKKSGKKKAAASKGSGKKSK